MSTRILDILKNGICLLIFAAAILAGCSGDGAPGSSSDSSVSSTAGQPGNDGAKYRDSSWLPKSGGTVQLVKDLASAGLRTDQAMISEASANESSVKMKVTHSGGCKEHSLTLFALEKLEKASPGEPAVGQLHLSHDAGGDNCEAAVTTDLTFDVLPLIEHYRTVEKYTGPVRLAIYAPGASEPSESVRIEVR